MRTGVAYLGHHNPSHMITDIIELLGLEVNDVLLAAQENDFVYMSGKIDYLPEIAHDYGIRPLIIFWGALNLFGGGRSSQFLLEHPQGHQVRADGSYHPAGCYNNRICVDYIKELIDRSAEKGFEGYFIDEPAPIDCYCPSCQQLFREWYDEDLVHAPAPARVRFRRRSVTHYIETIADYVKRHYSDMETLCCITHSYRQLWKEVATIATLDNLGTDIYWVNEDRNVREMVPLIHNLQNLCQVNGKKHHQWLQTWGVKSGNENRILQQGDILIKKKPDALYVWAFEGQVGTSEACENPQLAWSKACEVLKRAKNLD